MNPPVFSSAIYDGASVLVVWRPAMNPGITVTGFLVTVSGSDGSSFPKTFPGAVTSIGRVPTGALKTTVVYTVTVCAQATGQPNACTPPYVLIVFQPALTSVVYDGAAVQLAWTPLPASVTTIVSYTLSLFPTAGGATISHTIEQPSVSSGSIPTATPLTGAYSVQVLANTAYGASAATPVTDINTPLPVLQAAVYNGVAVSVGWRPPTGVTIPISGYTVLVSASGGGVPSFSTTAGAGATAANVPIPVPLDPDRHYVVTLLANAGTMVSTSAASAVIASLPTIVSIDWNGARLAATWNPVAYPDPPTTQYQLQAYPMGGGQSFSQTIQNPYATGGEIIGPAFTAGVAYMLTACAHTAFPEVCTVPVAIFTATPQITAVEFDGSHVTLTWSVFAPTQPAVARFRVSVTSASGQVFTKDIDNPSAVSTTIDVDGISRSAAASLQIAAISPAGVTATSTAVALALAQPTLDSAQYDGASVLAAWQPPSGVTVTHYVIRLVDRAGAILVSAQFPAGETTGTLTLGQPLSPTSGWTIAIVASTSGASVSSTPVSLLTDLPLLQSAAFDGTNVLARWTPVLTSDPPASGYQLKTYSTQGGGINITTVPNAAATQTSVAIPGAATLSYVAQICAYRGNVSACARTQPLMQSRVTFSSVQYDGAHLFAQWSAVADATGYTVSLIASGGSVVADAIVTGTTVTLVAICDPAQTYSLSVRARTALTTGPEATAAVISAIPGVLQLAATATQVLVTLDTTSTKNASGVEGYQASLYAGDHRVAGPIAAVTTQGVTTATFTYAVLPQTHYSVRVQAIGATAAARQGPLSAAVAVISASPTIEASSYDGHAVTASWSAVEQPGTSGYAVTITDATAGNTLPVVYTTARSISIAQTLQATHAYTVSVQAIGDVATGPSSGNVDPLAHSAGFFFPATGVSQYAYLFRGDIRGPGPAAITVYLPQLFTTPPASIPQDPFTLTRLANPVNASLPYTLTIAQNAAINVWSFTANGIRAALRTAYLAFLQKVEAPANGLLPGAMALLQQVIAQALPLTFAETLYYAYGFDATSGYVNLQPGMRLRVDFENRQFVSVDPQGTLSGFIGTGTSYFDIAALANGGPPPAIFDAFLGSMAVPLVAANTGGGAGAIDLQGSRFQQPYVRLFYPPTFPSSDSFGMLGASQNVVIVGAPTITKLEEATRTYLQNRNFNGVTGIYWTYFRGRATFIPEIACVVRGTPTWVSLGTTVRQLTGRFSPLPFGQSALVQGLDYRRSIGNIVDQPTQVASIYAYGRTNVVHFAFQSANTYRYTGGLDCFDLPVLAGDRIEPGA
jgi:hypothetical protein